MSPDPLDRFARAVAAHPDRVAVRDDRAALTFAELDARSARVAGALTGVRRGDRVGVALPRGADLLVALLATWRAGAAYVPLDPAYPEERLRYLREDTGVDVVLTDLSALPEPGGAPAEPVAVTGADAAYVIHTSGSTGRPKGVVATRGGVAALLTSLEDAGIYGTEPAVVAWNASASFDASVQQWVRVCRGDTVVVLAEDVRTDPERLAVVLDAHGVTDLDLTPAHWPLLREVLLTRDVHLFMGGEPVPPATWAEITAAGLRAVNLYGPTECTVDATAAPFAGTVPVIGPPLPGVVAEVLDERLRPAAEGELYLSGPGVARGYLGRPGLTATRFVAAPDGRRVYRTGDLVRTGDAGVLTHLGRTDRQVKFRGHRVEPGEIEAVLTGCAGVGAAVVDVRPVPPSGDQLVAYVTGDADPERLRAEAGALLPEHMVPTAYVAVAAIPLTVNGKVDHAALPDPDPSAFTGGGAALAGRYEEMIGQVWADVLGRDGVSADDDFFALGGHSLMALRVVSRVRRELGVSMPTKEVYRHPRLRDLAGFVANLAGAR